MTGLNKLYLKRSTHDQDNGGIFFDLLIIIVIIVSAPIVSMLVEPGSALAQESQGNASTTMQEAGTEDQFLQYSDAEYGVIITYPQDWDVAERDAASIVVFFSPAAALPENENVAVGHLALYVDRRAGVRDLSSYSETIIAEYEDSLEGFRVLGMESRTLAGGQAQQLIFDATDASGTFRALDVWTQRNGVVYHAVFYSPPSDFEADLSTVTAMLHSLEIGPALIDRPILGGNYELPQLGLQIQLPVDWAGYVIHEGNSTFAFVAPAEIQGNLGGADNSADFAVMFVYADPDERFEVQREWTAYGCESPRNASVVALSQVKAIEASVQCTDPQISQLKVYGFASTDDGFYVGFGTSSVEAYETYLSDFEESLRSVNLLDPGDPAEVTKYARIGGLESSIHQVLIGENAYDLYIASTSPVRNVLLDEAQNQLEFEVVKAESAGEAYLRAGYFLNGPYVVTVDGEIMEQGVELVRDGDAYYLSIKYDASQDHKVTITGSSVVPEFDASLSVLVPALVIGIILAARGRLGGQRFRSIGATFQL